jgi:hypothetical protein
VRALRCALVAVVFAAGCQHAPSERGRPAAERPAAETRSGSAARRSVTAPSGPRVENSASGRSGRLIARALSDLRRLGLWPRLTRHLYRIYLSAREGAVNVPDDKHLADALLTADIDRHGSGALCDVRFYPAAIARDRRRQRRFSAQGRLAHPPPTEREFWVSILAHELAHCLSHPNRLQPVGERVARLWEKRALRAARGIFE